MIVEGLLKLMGASKGPKEEPEAEEGGAALAARDALTSAATEAEVKEAFKLLKEACESEAE